MTDRQCPHIRLPRATDSLLRVGKKSTQDLKTALRLPVLHLLPLLLIPFSEWEKGPPNKKLPWMRLPVTTPAAHNCISSCAAAKRIIAKDVFMFARLVARQLRRPGRFLGYFVANMMERNNQKAIDWTIALTGIQPTDHVLELGVGPGTGIAGAAALASRGHVSGIDYSPAMVARAARRNRTLIANGRVDIGLGAADAMPFADNTLDRVFGVNIIYFWPTPKRELTEIRRILKPGGTVALFLSDKESMKIMPATQTPEFHTYTGEEFAAVVTSAGFQKVRVETLTVNREGMPFTIHCVIAVK